MGLVVGTALWYTVWSGAIGDQRSMRALSSVQTVRIALRKWLFAAADSARQPGPIFHSQKQKLEVKGTANGMGMACLYPQCQQKAPKVLQQCEREMHFEKGINVVFVSSIPLPVFCPWRFLGLAYHCETELYVLGLQSTEGELDG